MLTNYCFECLHNTVVWLMLIFFINYISPKSQITIIWCSLYILHHSYMLFFTSTCLRPSKIRLRKCWNGAKYCIPAVQPRLLLAFAVLYTHATALALAAILKMMPGSQGSPRSQPPPLSLPLPIPRANLKAQLAALPSNTNHVKVPGTSGYSNNPQLRALVKLTQSAWFSNKEGK